MRKVFLSYSRRNAVQGRALAEDLEALGHEVWLDQELGGGQRWWDQILAQVRDCDVFACAVAPESLESDACRRELAYAEALHKPILPVLIGDVSTKLLPANLAQLQLVDHRQADRVAALSLARAFTVLPETPPLPTPMPEVPEAPLSYLGGLQHQVDSNDPLDFAAQSGLMLQIKGALSDPETRDDARTLLEQLRKRRDLLAVIADEIDALMKAADAAPTPRPKPKTEERPVLKVSPTRIDFGTISEEDSATERLLVQNVGTGDLEWDFRAQGSFFAARRTGSKLVLELDTSDVGKFEGAVVVTGNGGEVIVPVRASVKAESQPAAPVRPKDVDISGAWQSAGGVGYFTGSGGSYQYQSANALGMIVEQGTAQVSGNRVIMQGQNVVAGNFHATLTVQGDTMTGTMNTPMGKLPITLQKVGGAQFFNPLRQLF